MRPSVKSVVCAVALTGALSLSACSGAEENPSSDPSGAESSASQGSDEGQVVEEGDTSVTTYQSIPPDFPSEVPILEESEATGSVTRSPDFEAYSVVVGVDQSPLDSMQDAVDLLVDAGFEGNATVSETEAGPAPVNLTLDDPELVVILTSAAVGDGSVVTYSVEAR